MPPNQNDMESGTDEHITVDTSSLVDQLRGEVQRLTEQIAGLAQQSRVPPLSGASGQSMQSNGERIAFPHFKPPKPPAYSGTNRDHTIIAQ